MKWNHFLQVWETLQRLLVSKKDIISRIISGGSDSRLPAIVLPLTEQWRVTSQHFVHCSPLNLMKSDSFPKWRLNQFKFSSTSTSKLYTTTYFHFRVVSFVYTRTFQLIADVIKFQIQTKFLSSSGTRRLQFISVKKTKHFSTNLDKCRLSISYKLQFLVLIQ